MEETPLGRDPEPEIGSGAKRRVTIGRKRRITPNFVGEIPLGIERKRDYHNQTLSWESESVPFDADEGGVT